VESAIAALRDGASDYLTKPFRLADMANVVKRALDAYRLGEENRRLRNELDREHRFEDLLGVSEAMDKLKAQIVDVARSDASVLVQGESGTGKELVARAVHAHSRRRGGPFVAVNCAALPETLLESELFGHMKGSFTGAIQNKRGLFEEAGGGTLFLDEISTVSPAIQVKLLRVLQERKIQRIGGREPIPVDFRLICATYQDLAALVERGDFREDLFYRLNVFPIRVPTLKERREDIPLLANYFRVRFAEQDGVEPPEIPPDTMGRMMAYDWPGNVRELENFIERAIIMHAGAKTIPFEPPNGLKVEPTRELAGRARDERWDLARLEREHILEVLEQEKWHQGAAARVLGINRRTLYRKLKRYREEGILPEEAASSLHS
ncbi:MAG: sigma-54-dependent Fis family transcriptional regulator, partial [Gemmatimonadetes bacterium]|nr:sigma-54-dependent Fis family transcriptional regulator [Gemmatimonadota bacterium]